MAKCDRSTSLFPGCGGGGTSRLWPVFSDAALRRRIIGALVCGVSAHSLKPNDNDDDLPIPPPLPPPPSEPRKSRGSDRLVDLFKAEAEELRSVAAEREKRRRVEAMERLQGAVRGLRDDNEVRRKEAAEEVRRLAKDNAAARETLAMMGAIPPLVGMLDLDGDADAVVAALYALLNLGIGNDVNKGAIFEAGAVEKMLNLIELNTTPAAALEAIVANFLGLSALDDNKPLIGASAAVPFLVRTFQTLKRSPQARQDALRALFNLSLVPTNAPYLVASGLVTAILIALVGDDEDEGTDIANRALSVLSNLVASTTGRRALSRAGTDAYPALVDALNWADAPGCQEKAAYVLMVMAHKPFCSVDRAAMVEAGAVSALLELTLLGSALAQRRASRVLECLRPESGKQVSEGFEGGAGRGCGSSASAAGAEGLEWGDGDGEGGGSWEMSEERRAVRELVQQSLQSNMRRIVKRANLPHEFVPSEHFRALTTSATSKSLPL